MVQYRHLTKRTEEASLSAPVRREPTRVLLAEDDREMRRLIAETLREDGYEVNDVANGIQLLDELAAIIEAEEAGVGPHMIISDIRMPGVTGMEVLAGLHDTRWEVPVILITGFGDHETHERAEGLGAIAVFDKPFPMDNLRKTVRRLRPPTVWTPIGTASDVEELE